LNRALFDHRWKLKLLLPELHKGNPLGKADEEPDQLGGKLISHNRSDGPLF
jgi:hypothetical protein